MAQLTVAVDSMKRTAIVGAGPSGFYAADQLLKAGWEVDLFDALPTPYWKFRAAGDADSPEINSVIRFFAKTSALESSWFFGGVMLGRAVSREDLRERYHAVV